MATFTETFTVQFNMGGPIYNRGGAARTLSPIQQICAEIRQLRIEAIRVIYEAEQRVRREEESRQYNIRRQIRERYQEGADRKKQKRKAHYFLHRATESLLCDDDSIIDCISLEPFKKGERLAKIRACGHTFAQAGLKQWIGINPSCPICRCTLT